MIIRFSCTPRVRSGEPYTAVEPTDIGYFLLGLVFERTGDSERAKLAYQQAERSSRDMTQTRQAAAKLLAE